MQILPVPYVSQLEPGAQQWNNDCGAAAALSLLWGYGLDLTMTVDELYLLCTNGYRSDRYLSATEIRVALGKRGLQTEWQVELNIGQLYMALAAGRAGIALINYGVLVRAGLTQRTNFTGSHFVCVVGLDIANIVIHDPYQTGVSGAAVHVPYKVFTEAWTATNQQGNLARGWLGCEHSIYEPLPPKVSRYKIHWWMNVRDNAGWDAKVIGSLRYGDIVEVFEIQGDWGRIGEGRWLYMGEKSWVRPI